MHFRRYIQDMKIAATYSMEDGSVFQHFGRTESFRIYTIDDGKVTGSETVSAAETGGHSALAPFLMEKGVEALICGGLGGGARAALQSLGIKVYPGVSGSADKAAEAFASGTLEYDEDASCHHHDGEHQCHGHGEGHECGHGGGEGHHCCH